MTTTTTNTSSIVSKVWAFCNTLRDDGVGYGKLSESGFSRLKDDQDYIKTEN